MLNQAMIVGRMTEEVEIKVKEGKEYTELVLAVPRSEKNEEGIYESDFIPVTIQGALADNVKEYCHKGDLVGVKGRLKATEDNIVVVAEKVTFLANKKSEE